MLSITGVNTLPVDSSRWNCAANTFGSRCSNFPLQIQQKCYQNKVFTRYTLAAISFHMKNRFEASFKYTSMKLHNNTLKLQNISVCSYVGVFFKHENKNVCVRPIFEQKCMCKYIFRIKIYVQAHFGSRAKIKSL